MAMYNKYNLIFEWSIDDEYHSFIISSGIKYYIESVSQGLTYVEAKIEKSNDRLAFIPSFGFFDSAMNAYEAINHNTTDELTRMMIARDIAETLGLQMEGN